MTSSTSAAASEVAPSNSGLSSRSWPGLLKAVRYVALIPFCILIFLLLQFVAQTLMPRLLNLSFFVVAASATVYCGEKYLGVVVLSPFTRERVARAFFVTRSFITGYPEESSSTVTVPPLTEFTIFSKFPAEIRAMVWKEVSHQARVVVIRYNRDENDSIDRSFCPCISKNTPPTILQVNSESRRIGLKYYSLKSDSKGHQSYVNPEADIIFIASFLNFYDYQDEIERRKRWMTTVEAYGWLKNVRYLALRTDQIRTLTPPIYSEVKIFNKAVQEQIGPLSKQLRQLILVDPTRANDERVVRYLVPLKLNDVISDYWVVDQVVKVKEYTELITEQMKQVVDGLKEKASEDWMESFSPPEIKAMQLRYPYENGHEGIAPPEEQEEVKWFPKWMRPRHKQIHLGKFRKAENGWEIIKC